MLSANHNPGRPDEDIGIKYNVADGGPAPESVTDAIYADADDRPLSHPEVEDTDLGRIGTTSRGDICGRDLRFRRGYATLMESLFDFGVIRPMISQGFNRPAFDSMNAVTGPLCGRDFQKAAQCSRGNRDEPRAAA